MDHQKNLPFLNIIGIWLLLFVVISCKGESKEELTTTDGIWQSIGYGRVVQIDNGEYVLSDVTAISCIPLMEGNISDFDPNLHLVNDTILLKDGINRYYFTRIPALPEPCSQDLSAKKTDPVYNFEVLASTFEDHYAYFDLRAVDWDSLYTVTKGKITSETNNGELYVILEDMLNSFNDGHIGLDAPDVVEDSAETLRDKSNTTSDIPEKRYGDHEVSNLVAEHYLKDKKKSSYNKMVQWGILEDNIGYLQVNQMMGLANLNLPDSLTGRAYWETYFGKLEDLTSEKHTTLEVEGIRETMEIVLSDLGNTDALILDVRFNGGGKDEVGMEVIRHFNPSKQTVFSKMAKLGDAHTQPNFIELNSAKDPYTKPVYLLTSQQSASATEIMVLSSLLLEHVTRIGAHTEGVFSDVLDKVLPNEWEFGLSNEVYLDTKGNNYEGKGIPVDVNLDYPEDRQTFFRQLVENLEGDRQKVLELILIQ